jgi:hypothetical protein
MQYHPVLLAFNVNERKWRRKSKKYENVKKKSAISKSKLKKHRRRESVNGKWRQCREENRKRRKKKSEEKINGVIEEIESEVSKKKMS